MDICSNVFNVTYTIEAFIKVNGLGCILYFADGWNKFDFTIVVVAWVGFFSEQMGI